MLPPAAVGVVTRPLPRLRLVDRPLVLKDRLGPSTIRAAIRRRVPWFFSRTRLRAPTGAILEGHASLSTLEIAYDSAPDFLTHLHHVPSRLSCPRWRRDRPARCPLCHVGVATEPSGFLIALLLDPCMKMARRLIFRSLVVLLH